MGDQQQDTRNGRGNVFRLFVIVLSLIFGYSTGQWDVWLMVMLLLCLVSSWIEDKAVAKVAPVLDAQNPRVQAVYEDETTDEDDPILSSQNDEALETVSEPVPNQYGMHAEPLAKRDIIEWLAQQRNENGTYTHSANKIADFFGGTRADVLRIIRDVREGDAAKIPDTHQHEPPRRANSAYDEVVYFLDNGKAVRRNKYGAEYVLDGNQEIPVSLYRTTLETRL